MAAQRAHIYEDDVKNVSVLEDPRNDLLKQAKEQEKRERARYRAQENRMGRLYVFFLTMAALLLVFGCYQFMKLQSTMNKNVSTISSLNVTLEDMKAENDFNLNLINESVDLDDIREQAINRLGMTEATTAQVITYTYDQSDYVRQYSDVTDGDDSSVLDYFTD